MKDQVEMVKAKNSHYMEIQLDSIDANPGQPRKTFEESSLDELKNSIEKNGVLQPILVRRNPENNRYQLIAGERRYRASLMAGLSAIPAIVRESDSIEDLELAITENLLREDLNPIEEAESVLELKEMRHYTDQQIAEITGKSRTSIAEILSLNRLPEKVKEECRNSGMPPAKSLLLYIAREGDEKAMTKAWNRFQKGQYSILQAKNGKKKKPEENKFYRWRYQNKNYTISLRFNKEEVDDEEIANALKQAAKNIKKIKKEEVVTTYDEKAQLNFFDVI